MFIVVLTIQRGSGRLLTSPDIISRGFIYMRDSEELMNLVRQYLKQKATRSFSGRYDLDTIKKEIKDEVTHILYDQTRRTPIVIPVINEIGGGGQQNREGGNRGQAQQNANRPERPVGGAVNRQPRKFPPRQVPDTEVADPSLRSQTETRAY